MPYFQQFASSLALPLGSDEQLGLRRAQYGALHAIAAHFTIHREAALVSMPTGTGKTAVLMAAPFLLRASRALVVTPSRMVRDQIADGFMNLELLKSLGVLPAEQPAPSVLAIESKILLQAQWSALNTADVVVTTPMGASPALESVPQPPADLFDLVLIDEAHHSPAKTWRALIESFGAAKCVMFTATPFRRDRKLLPGRFVYEFALREAIADGVFGSIRFVACEPGEDEGSDVAIAKAIEREYRADRDRELDHRIMVRTDRRTRAKELLSIYRSATALRLGAVHGNHTLRHVRSVVGKLRSGDLDGVICVDMFGEGFDLPQLKLAAIHSPHKSLPATLQFIGRFARTGRPGQFGDAKFVAVPTEIESETKLLYRQGAVWEHLVTNLADSRVEAERELREQLDTFDATEPEADEAELTLDTICPWFHSKVFHASGAVDLHADIKLPSRLVLVQRFVSDDLACAVYIGASSQAPRWLDSQLLTDAGHELFVVYYDEASRLLFINSTLRTEEVYSYIAEQLVEGAAFTGLSTAHINRALRSLENPRFFNIGLKNRLFGSRAESYRILSGSGVDRAVSSSDAQRNDRGHVFGSGDSSGKPATLGISTLSKVWSNRTGFVPEFIAWCCALAEHLTDSSPVVTNSRIDLLATGEETNAIPAAVIAAGWHEKVYKLMPVVFLDGAATEAVELLAMDIEIAGHSATHVDMTLSGLGIPVHVRFDLGGPRHYTVRCDSGTIKVGWRQVEQTLDVFLNEHGLNLYLADFSRLQGREYFPSNLSAVDIAAECIDAKDWSALGVDITCECSNDPAVRSVHKGVREMLVASNASVVVYDHRSGEIADFVALEGVDRAVRCEVYHCKASGGDQPGCRVGDVYEVVGQIIKCLRWSQSPLNLRTHLTRRLAMGSQLAKGSVPELERLLHHAQSAAFEFHIRLVQPGLSVARMTPGVRNVLAASIDYIRSNTGIAPMLWVSA